jgi:hypothetical protein
MHAYHPTHFARTHGGNIISVFFKNVGAEYDEK